MGERPWLWTAGPRQGRGLGGGHTNAQEPPGCGGWCLGSRNRRGPGVPPIPGLRGQGTSSGSPAGFLSSSGWGKHPPLLSCSSGLGSGRAHPTCLSWSTRPPSYAPKDPCSLEGAWRAGDWPGNSAVSPWPSGWGNHLPLLSHSSRMAPPACLS